MLTYLSIFSFAAFRNLAYMGAGPETETGTWPNTEYVEQQYVLGEALQLCDMNESCYSFKFKVAFQL